MSAKTDTEFFQSALTCIMNDVKPACGLKDLVRATAKFALNEGLSYDQFKTLTDYVFLRCAFNTATRTGEAKKDIASRLGLDNELFKNNGVSAAKKRGDRYTGENGTKTLHCDFNRVITRADSASDLNHLSQITAGFAISEGLASRELKALAEFLYLYIALKEGKEQGLNMTRIAHILDTERTYLYYKARKYSISTFSRGPHSPAV